MKLRIAAFHAEETWRGESSDRERIRANLLPSVRSVNSGDMPEDESEKPSAPLACWNRWYANGCPET